MPPALALAFSSAETCAPAPVSQTGDMPPGKGQLVKKKKKKSVEFKQGQDHGLQSEDTPQPSLPAPNPSICSNKYCSVSMWAKRRL